MTYLMMVLQVDDAILTASAEEETEKFLSVN